MCDQSEISYRPGHVVWVKLGPVWWPGVVADDEEIPSEVHKMLRKTPIAIVKFFQEKEFEYVHKLSNIYHYNCSKKNDFIRKGLDTYRSKNRDAHSNMKLFPDDVVRAEILTGGDPNILNDKIFQPEEKPTYSDFFASTKKSLKKVKPDSKKKSSIRRETQQSSIPRIITHPRFIKLSSGMETDYEVRERKQEPIRAECDEEDISPPTTYRCQDCDFTTIRLNVIVLHNKLHTRNYIQPTPSKVTKRKNISAVRVKERPSANEWKSKSSQSTEIVKPKVSETNGTVQRTGKRGRPRKIGGSLPNASVKIATKTKEPEQKKKSRASIAKPSQSLPLKDEFQESLLEDWAEFETELDNTDNGDTKAESCVGAEERTTDENKTADKNQSINKKDEFDFDDSEEQLFIDKSNIRAGRKIPRVLENKVDEVESNEVENRTKRKVSNSQEKPEGTEIETQAEDKRSKSENVRKRKMSGTRKESSEEKTENEVGRKQSSDSLDVKKTRLHQTRSTSREEKEKSATEVETECSNEKSTMEQDSEGIEVKVEEKKPTMEVEIEENHEVEVENEIEIEIEQSLDDDYESSSAIDEPASPAKESEDDVKEKEATELSQKVEQLLQEVSLPSQLPELPRSHKKEQIKSYNASLRRSVYDDQIIESISLINDDSSDGCDDKVKTENETAGQGGEKRRQSNETQSCVSESIVDSAFENIEITSDSSPEIVSVEIPKVGGITKKVPTTPLSTTVTSPKRPPVRFTVMSKLKSINPHQVSRRNSNQMISGPAAKMLKTAPQHSNKSSYQLHPVLQSKGRSSVRGGLKLLKSAEGRNMIRSQASNQVAGANISNSASKPKKYLLLKQTPHTSTIASIDLTGSKDQLLSSGIVESLSTPNVVSKSLKSVNATNKISSKNTVFVPSVSVHNPVSSTIDFVSSSGSALISVQDSSEIITVTDDNNEQTEEMDFFVDEAGNVIAENTCSTSKKEDILAKALQNTDGLQCEMALSSSAIVLNSCNLPNTSSTTVYENVTLNTPPIMSSFEAPSRTMNANLSNISEYIIISDAADNIQ